MLMDNEAEEWVRTNRVERLGDFRVTEGHCSETVDCVKALNTVLLHSFLASRELAAIVRTFLGEV